MNVDDGKYSDHLILGADINYLLDWALKMKWDSSLKIQGFNRTLNFTEHTNFLNSKANQCLGLLKLTCHLVNYTSKRRALYLGVSYFVSLRTLSNGIVASVLLTKLQSLQKSFKVEKSGPLTA